MVYDVLGVEGCLSPQLRVSRLGAEDRACSALDGKTKVVGL